MRRLGDVLSLFLMLLGSITLALLLGVGVYWAWITRLQRPLGSLDRPAAVLSGHLHELREP